MRNMEHCICLLHHSSTQAQARSCRRSCIRGLRGPYGPCSPHLQRRRVAVHVCDCVGRHVWELGPPPPAAALPLLQVVSVLLGQSGSGLQRQLRGGHREANTRANMWGLLCCWARQEARVVRPCSGHYEAESAAHERGMLQHGMPARRSSATGRRTLSLLFSSGAASHRACSSAPPPLQRAC